LDDGWDFHAAFAIAAGVIPTLLLALVLEKQLLLAALRGSQHFRRSVEDLPPWVKRLSVAIPGFDAIPVGAVVQVMPGLTAPRSAIMVAVLAEMVSLVGVAIPESWMQGPGHIASFICLALVGYAVLMLMLHVAMGLMSVVATEGDSEDAGEDSDSREDPI
jgi:hypothetical protein